MNARTVIGMVLLALASVIPAPAHADPPAPAPQPVLPPLASGQVVRIGPTAGTGTPTRDYGIGATDLCEFMEFPSGILQVCGDSFAGQGVGFGGYYSPVALHVETDSIDDPTGVRYDGVTGTDKPLLDEPTPPGSSQLPAGIVEINRENYMLVTTDEGPGARNIAVGEGRSGEGELADGAEVSAARRLRGWAAVADQRLLRPDPDAGLVEWLGVHRGQRLRPQRPGGALPVDSVSVHRQVQLAAVVGVRRLEQAADTAVGQTGSER